MANLDNLLIDPNSTIVELKLNHTRTFEKLEVFGRYLTRRTDSALVTPNPPRRSLGVFGVTRAESVLLVRYRQNIPRAKPSGNFAEILLFSQMSSCDFTYNIIVLLGFGGLFTQYS